MSRIVKQVRTLSAPKIDQAEDTFEYVVGTMIWGCRVASALVFILFVLTLIWGVGLIAG